MTLVQRAPPGRTFAASIALAAGGANGNERSAPSTELGPANAAGRAERPVAPRRLPSQQEQNVLAAFTTGVWETN